LIYFLKRIFEEHNEKSKMGVKKRGDEKRRLRIRRRRKEKYK